VYLSVQCLSRQRWVARRIVSMDEISAQVVGVGNEHKIAYALATHVPFLCALKALRWNVRRLAHG
jgi:hypothetical protein